MLTNVILIQLIRNNHLIQECCGVDAQFVEPDDRLKRFKHSENVKKFVP